MRLVVDTHVHLYDCYDLRAAFSAAFENLRSIAGETNAAVSAICMVERSGQRVFQQLGCQERTIGLEFDISEAPGGDALIVSRGSDRVFVLPGRQVVTRERIEILGLFLPTEVVDGLSAEETLQAIHDAGGLPVLCWAPGKWLFRRGKLVRRLIEKNTPDSLLVGDTSLRPRLWPEPALQKLALHRGMKRVYGSDPLPFSGEERLIGSYVTLFEAPFDAAVIAFSFKNAFLSKGRAAGLRSNCLRAGIRLWRNRRVSAGHHNHR